MGFSGSGPFRDIESMLERVTDELETAKPGMARQPLLDVEDTDDAFVVTVDLPGFEKTDVDIELREDTLTISAEHDEETKQELDSRYVRRERRHSSVSRTVTLPEPLDEETASATYEHGVLTIELPKTQQETGTTVDIE